MSLGSFAAGALMDVAASDIERMLGLDETLFVEHKRGIGKDEAFQIVKAVASFANTAGGWLLLWVHESAVVAVDADDRLRGELNGTPALVDAIRDRIRGQLDPLPAFEARIIEHRDGPVGVVRVYESSDTPHVALKDGAVYVREVAGGHDARDPRRSGGGASADRAYEVAKIRSRAELVELANRGRRAEERVQKLLNTPITYPLVAEGLGFRFARSPDGGFLPVPDDRGRVVVRIAPYTLIPRFRGWATTHDGAAAIMHAAEDLADMHGLASGWVTPDPAGGSIEVPCTAAPHSTSFHPLKAWGHVVIDGVGMSGAALSLEPPDGSAGVLRARLEVNDLATKVILPALKAAAEVLAAGEFIGRSRCQVDLLGLQSVLLLEHQGDHVAPAEWVPHTSDVTIPAGDAELEVVATRVAYAYARSARLPFWDAKAPPSG